jgi:hypothetical protein
MVDPIEPSVCKADSIILQAIENLPPLDERFVSEKISNKRFKVGDAIVLDTFGGKVPFVVLGLVTYCSEMEQDGKALVTENTSIILLPSDATIRWRQQ